MLSRAGIWRISKSFCGEAAGSVAGAETLKTRCVVCHAFVFARDAKTLVLNCKNVKRVPRARLFQVLCLSLLVFLARVFVHV